MKIVEKPNAHHQPRPHVEKVSALAKPSRLEPDPEGRARAKAEKERLEKVAATPVSVESTKFLDLGAGYKLQHKPGSGHSVVVRVLAEAGKFAEVAESLKEGKYDVRDKDQATDLLTKLMVKKDSVEGMVRDDAQFKRHASKRVADLKKRAEQGDAAAMRATQTLANETRICNEQWVGNVKEIISTCNGSYLTENRNVRKFRDAGVIFRQFPIDPKGADQVYLMLYPAAFRKTIIDAIQIVYGVDEESQISGMKARKQGRRAKSK